MVGLQGRRKAATDRHRLRADAGVYMVELIIALGVSALLAGAIIGSLAETERFSTSGQNQIIAGAIAQMMADNLRTRSYDWLEGHIGTFYWHVPPEGSDSGPSIIARPLQNSTSKFIGLVTLTLSPGADNFAGTLNAEIKIDWNEGANGRSYTMSTRIARNGIHN